MHEHTPIKYQNILLRCLVLLCSPVKVFHYCIDGFDVCDQCGTLIALPHAYYSPVSSIFYFLAGIGISITMVAVPFLEELISLLLFFVFHHVFSSIVFGCFLWIDFKGSEQAAQTFREDAKKELWKKCTWYIIGLINGIVLNFCFF